MINASYPGKTTQTNPFNCILHNHTVNSVDNNGAINKVLI